MVDGGTRCIFLIRPSTSEESTSRTTNHGSRTSNSTECAEVFQVLASTTMEASRGTSEGRAYLYQASDQPPTAAVRKKRARAGSESLPPLLTSALVSPYRPGSQKYCVRHRHLRRKHCQWNLRPTLTSTIDTQLITEPTTTESPPKKKSKKKTPYQTPEPEPSSKKILPDDVLDKYALLKICHER